MVYIKSFYVFSHRTLHKKWSFPLRITSVNATKSAGTWRDLVTFTEEILTGKLYFFVQWNACFCSCGMRVNSLTQLSNKSHLIALHLELIVFSIFLKNNFQMFACKFLWWVVFIHSHCLHCCNLPQILSSY